MQKAPLKVTKKMGQKKPGEEVCWPFFYRISHVVNAATIIVYDTDWNDVIGVSASKRLMELGHSNVYTLQGGIEAWVADGGRDACAAKLRPRCSTIKRECRATARCRNRFGRL